MSTSAILITGDFGVSFSVALYICAIMCSEPLFALARETSASSSCYIELLDYKLGSLYITWLAIESNSL